MRLAAITILLALIAAPALAADPVQGIWLARGGAGAISIAPCLSAQDQLCGTITWVRNPADAVTLDANNPIPAMRVRPILGMPVLWGHRQTAPGRWSGGKIYDPNSGRTYNSRISMQPDGLLKVEACVAVVCQVQSWSRVYAPSSRERRTAAVTAAPIRSVRPGLANSTPNAASVVPPGDVT